MKCYLFCGFILESGVLAAIIVGSLVVVLIIVLVGYIVAKRRK